MTDIEKPEFPLELFDLTADTAERKDVQKMVAAWRTQKAYRMALDKLANQAKSIEVLAQKWLVGVMYSQEWEGIVIDGRITGVSTKDVPDVIDKEEFLDYIRETGELDLLQFRPAVGAINQRLSEEVEVPGIAIKEVPTLFDRKAN